VWENHFKSRYFLLWIVIVILLSISHLFTSRKTFLWPSFSSHSLLILFSFLLTFYNSDYEENESESDKRKLQREDEDGASCVQSFSFFLTKLVEEMVEKRAPNWQRRGQSCYREKKTTKRVWNFMVWLMMRKLCGLFLSVLKINKMDVSNENILDFTIKPIDF